ncbi:hypothetical protein AALO_G00025220, partial [Alosa alosa]
SLSHTALQVESLQGKVICLHKGASRGASDRHTHTHTHAHATVFFGAWCNGSVLISLAEQPVIEQLQGFPQDNSQSSSPNLFSSQTHLSPAIYLSIYRYPFIFLSFSHFLSLPTHLSIFLLFSLTFILLLSTCACFYIYLSIYLSISLYLLYLSIYLSIIFPLFLSLSFLLFKSVSLCAHTPLALGPSFVITLCVCASYPKVLLLIFDPHLMQSSEYRKKERGKNTHSTSNQPEQEQTSEWNG